MITILKNNENNFIFSGSEYSDKDFFTIKLKHQQNKNSVIFTGNDISSSTTRYNNIVVIETGLTYQNLSAGIVCLDEGFWDYIIYSNDSLNLQITGTPIEYGIVNVVNTEETGTFDEYFLDNSGVTQYYLGNI